MAFSYGMGKGLREPCSPFREANVFGAELDAYNANNWNCLPQIVGETTTFDVSSISPGHEIAIALVNITSTPGGNNSVRWDWYRNRDNALIRSVDWPFTSYSGGWFYIHCGTAWVAWEIDESGDYRVEITVTGAINYYKVIQFTVTGIPEEPEAPEAPVDWLLEIRDYVTNAAGWFGWAKNETAGWIYPFSLISDLFHALSLGFWHISYRITDAHSWAVTIVQMIGQGISWTTIWSAILGIIPNLESIRDWYYDWWTNVTGVVESWWSLTSVTVTGWIDASKVWAKLWIDYLDSRIDTVQVQIGNILAQLPDVSGVLAWFSNWPGHVLSIVNTWWTSTMGDVQNLINSAFTVRQGLWSGWQDVRDNVVEFFSDPVEFIWARFTDWFLGTEV